MKKLFVLVLAVALVITMSAAVMATVTDDTSDVIINVNESQTINVEDFTEEFTIDAIDQPAGELIDWSESATEGILDISTIQDTSKNGGDYYNLEVSITDETDVPAGTNLSVDLTEELSSEDSNVVTVGPNQGTSGDIAISFGSVDHSDLDVKYTIDVVDVSDLDADDDGAVTITYTIIDDSA